MVYAVPIFSEGFDYSYKKYLYCSQPFTNSKFKLHVFMGWYLCVVSLCDWKPFKKSCKFMIAYVIFFLLSNCPTLKNPYAYFELGLLHWNSLFMWEFAVLKCFGAGQKSLNGFPRALNCCSMLVQSIFFTFKIFLKLKIRNLCKSFF